MTTSSVLSLGVAFLPVIVFCSGCMTTVPVAVEASTTTILSKVPENLEDPKVLESTSTVTNRNKKSDLFLGEDGRYYSKGSDVPFSGKAEIVSFYGELIYEGQFVDGVREGEGIEWHEDGNKKYVGRWNAGKFYSGTVCYYYARTDQVSLRGQYIEGILVSGINLDRNGKSY